MSLEPIILAELQRGGPPLWVSGRTYPKGWEVRSPANLQRYVRKVAGAGATDPSADTDNWEPWTKTVETLLSSLSNSVANVKAVVDSIRAAPRGIKSIQRGVTTRTLSANKFTDVTIAAVDPSKTAVSLLSATVVGGSYNNVYQQQVALLNATTLRVYGCILQYNSTYGYQYTGEPVSWEVVEYYS